MDVEIVTQPDWLPNNRTATVIVHCDSQVELDELIAKVRKMRSVVSHRVIEREKS